MVVVTQYVCSIKTLTDEQNGQRKLFLERVNNQEEVLNYGELDAQGQ